MPFLPPKAAPTKTNNRVNVTIKAIVLNPFIFCLLFP
jgi:hypothetical protein